MMENMDKRKKTVSGLLVSFVIVCIVIAWKLYSIDMRPLPRIIDNAFEEFEDTASLESVKGLSNVSRNFKISESAERIQPSGSAASSVSPGITRNSEINKKSGNEENSRSSASTPKAGPGRSKDIYESEVIGALILTPSLRKDLIDNARNQATVTHPDLPNIKSYSGYFNVGRTNNSNLFFWYFPSMQPSGSRSPVVLFFESSSSVPFGVFRRNGQFFMTPDGRIQRRKESWHNNFHMIYIDSLVGLGFSFMNSYNHYPSMSDISAEISDAMTQFFMLFPSLRRNPFFVVGESMAAQFIPLTVVGIDKYNQASKKEEKINLQGLAIGNGWVQPIDQLIYSDSLHDFGLIDDHEREKFIAMENKTRKALIRNEHREATLNLESLVWGPNSLFSNFTGYQSLFNILETELKRENYEFVDWIQREDVRRALHVGNNTFKLMSPNVLDRLRFGMTRPMGNKIASLLEKYRVLIYTGDLDMMCSYHSVQNWLENLDWSGEARFRTARREQWRVRNNELAGYIRKVDNLIEVHVRNAGHFPSRDQPQRILELMKKFTDGSI